MKVPSAVVPVRIGPTAKRRLAHVLAPPERARLVRRLFEGVVSALRGAGLEVIALSPTPLADATVEVWTDAAPGLNRALAAAIARLAGPVLVVPADLAALTPADVDEVLRVHADVVVARAHDGGTNGLLLRSRIRPAFGPDSALVHARRARAAGLRCSVVDVDGFAVDIDTPRDLRALGARIRP